MEKQRPVHREATDWVEMHRLHWEPTGLDGTAETGCGVPQYGGTDLCLSSYGQNGVLLIGRGVAYHKTEETDLCWSAYGRNGVLFIGRGVAYRKTGLHGLPFIHRLVPRSSLHGLLFIHR
jgi:hypothetical protein